MTAAERAEALLRAMHEDVSTADWFSLAEAAGELATLIRQHGAATPSGMVAVLTDLAARVPRAQRSTHAALQAAIDAIG